MGSPRLVITILRGGVYVIDDGKTFGFEFAGADRF